LKKPTRRAKTKTKITKRAIKPKKVKVPKRRVGPSKKQKKVWTHVKTFKPVTENTYDEVGEYVEFTLDENFGDSIVCMIFVDTRLGQKFGSWIDTPENVLRWWIERGEDYFFALNPNALVQVAYKPNKQNEPSQPSAKRKQKRTGNNRKSGDKKPKRKLLRVTRVKPGKPANKPSGKQRRNVKRASKSRKPVSRSNRNTSRLRKK